MSRGGRVGYILAVVGEKPLRQATETEVLFRMRRIELMSRIVSVVALWARLAAAGIFWELPSGQATMTEVSQNALGSERII
jgi:hypothetical protein